MKIYPAIPPYIVNSTPGQGQSSLLNYSLISDFILINFYDIRVRSNVIANLFDNMKKTDRFPARATDRFLHNNE